MSQLAIAGNAPAPHGSSNVAEWIFSNPFSKDGGAMKHVTPEMRRYAIPIISRDKPLVTDPATGGKCITVLSTPIVLTA